MKMTARIIKLIALVVGSWIGVASVSAQSEVDFKGKTIRLITAPAPAAASTSTLDWCAVSRQTSARER